MAEPGTDPYDILREEAGPASRRARARLETGRRPSNRTLDRAVKEKKAQAERFFDAVGATQVGKAFYSGVGVWIDPALGAAPVLVYATDAVDLREAEYFLMDGSGAVLPHFESWGRGYPPGVLHQMILDDELMPVDNQEGLLLQTKWALAAGVPFHPNDQPLQVYESPDPSSRTRTVEPGTEVEFAEFKHEWVRIQSLGGDTLGWLRWSSG